MNNKKLKKIIVSLLSDYRNAFSANHILDMLSREGHIKLSEDRITSLCANLVEEGRLKGYQDPEITLYYYPSSEVGKYLTYSQITVFSFHPNTLMSDRFVEVYSEH